MGTRNEWIDLLRALAAIAVALFHFNVIVPTMPAGGLARAWHEFWLQGHLGVSVFFALSGYFLLPGWLRAGQAIQFLGQRLVRLMVPYWFSLLLVTLLALAFKFARGVNDVAVLPRTGHDLVATMLLLTDPLTAVPRVNWVYWTLTVLLFYTAGTGLILLLPARARLPLLAGAHVALCAADLVLLPRGAGFPMLLKYWPMFGGGIALALRGTNRTLGNWLVGASAGHALVSLLLGHDDLGYALAAMLTVAAIAVAPRGPLPRRIGPLAGIGRSFYSLFLVHVPVGVYLLHRWLPAESGGTLQLIGGQLLLLAASIGAGGLFYLACERSFSGARA